MKKVDFFYPDKLSEIFESNSHINVIYGGRSSGKTYSVVLYNLLWTLKTGQNTLAFRLKEGNIKLSIYSTYREIIQNSILNDYFTVMAESIRCKTNNAIIDFMGIFRKGQSLKGIDGRKFFIIDEATDLTREDAQVLEGTFARFTKARIFYLFNPYKEDDYIYETYVKNQKTIKDLRGDNFKICNINWYDNPFCKKDELFSQTIMQDRAILPDYVFKHKWEGEILTMSDALVFAHKIKTFNSNDEPNIKEIFMQRFFYGIDWGFSKDVTAFTRSYIKGGCLYIDTEFGELQHQPQDVAEKLTTDPQFNWIAKHLISGTVYADPESPQAISAFKNHIVKDNFGHPYRIRCESALRSRKSYTINGLNNDTTWRESGIAYFLQFKNIYIHETRCPKTLKEFKKYSHKVDKISGQILRDFVEVDDHFIDATRYAHNDWIVSSNAILREHIYENVFK